MSIRMIKIFFVSFASLLCFSAYSQRQELQNEKHVEVALRMIGHQILLNAGDSTSRVLPIIENEGKYRIQFETEFEFEPETLAATINQVMVETNIAKSFIVEVITCLSGEVVYSYEMHEVIDSSIVPCRSRAVPKSCYTLLVTLADENQAESDLAIILPKEANVKSDPLKYIVGFSLILLGFAAYFLWDINKKKIVDSNLISIGAYRFDQRNMELLFGDQKTKLSGKETDLLLMLYKDVNNTVERDVILNQVWGDEGDYVGRTLDVFISKLRKKLEFDSSIKIDNIRGVGYKLVI